MGQLFFPPTTGQVVLLRPTRVEQWEVDLERINPFSFYDFGKEINAISELTGDSVTTRDAFWPLWQARGAMQNLIKGQPIPIGISSTKAKALLERINHIMDDRFSTKNEKGESIIRFPEDGDPPVASWSLNWMRTAITEFETVFAEEMRETATYFVPRRGIYYTPALVDSADETFPKELLPFIPQKAKDDWKSAGRCLAFNLLSASGFHVARAVGRVWNPITASLVGNQVKRFTVGTTT